MSKGRSLARYNVDQVLLHRVGKCEDVVEINQTLIERARAGHRESLERLLVCYCAELRAHIARRMPAFLKDKVSEEDVMQEALTQAYLKINGLLDTTPRAFIRWLQALGEMMLVDFIRFESRQKRGGQFRRQRSAHDSINGSTLVDLLEQLPSDGATASRTIARQEALDALQVALVGLPEAQRQAIELNLLRGKTVQQTAAAMGCTPGAVRGLVYRGKQNLADGLGRASAWLSS